MQNSQIQRLNDVFVSYPHVVAAWLFGSASKGRMRADSDIDVGVLFARQPTLDEWLDLHADLQDAFGLEDIDLVVLNRASPILRFEAISGQALYSRKREERTTFISLTARHYEESMALIARGYAARKAALARAET